jgi:hypothetical protein
MTEKDDIGIESTCFWDVKIEYQGLILVRPEDLVQVYTNFEIGCRIVHQEQHGKDLAAYGKEVLKPLAERLMGEFGEGSRRVILNTCAIFIRSMKIVGFTLKSRVEQMQMELIGLFI